jgi:tRNA A-37 threonylcarbamoyl transferase component Bud32
MKHPEKWRDTIDPFALPYNHFALTEVLGYPHAGNDVFQVRGIYQQREVEAFIKVARQRGADIRREIDTISTLGWDVLPTIIDHDEEKTHFVVTLAKEGERLSTILGANENLASMDYLYEYGQTLAKLHKTQGQFPDVKDRSYFHIRPLEQLEERGLQFIHPYLVEHQPREINRCFCHGDFHYANILWKDKHISAILDFELSGMGNKEFDIAWALILRPGQRFLKTEEEINLFLEGYRSEGTFCMEYVRYYMALIYVRFYDVGEGYDGYQDYVRAFLEEVKQEFGEV